MISPLNTPGNKKKTASRRQPIAAPSSLLTLRRPRASLCHHPPVGRGRRSKARTLGTASARAGERRRGGQRGHPRPGRPVGAAPRRGATAPPGGGTGRNRARLLPAASVQPPEEGIRKGGEGRSQEPCRVGAAPSRPVGCAEPGAAGLLLGRSGKGPGGGTAGRGARLSLAITRRCKQRE